MAKQTDIADANPDFKKPVTNMYKVTYAYVNDKGQLRNGALVTAANTPDEAKAFANETLSKEYDSHRIGSIKIW